MVVVSTTKSIFKPSTFGLQQRWNSSVRTTGFGNVVRENPLVDDTTRRLHAAVSARSMSGWHNPSQRNSLVTSVATFTTTAGSSSIKTATSGPYGLRMVDYNSTEPPPTWPLPPHPPERRKGFHILVFLPAAVFLAGAIYVFTHPDENIYEYWKQVDQGIVPFDDDDDDDDQDEWDDMEPENSKSA